MSENPLSFNPFKGDPRIPHGTEELLSTIIWGVNFGMLILHLPSTLGFRPFKLDKDLKKCVIEESAAVNRLRSGLAPSWPYHTPMLESTSVPAMWWKEAHETSWKVERQGSAVEQI
jgi:hypothetical protein